MHFTSKVLWMKFSATAAVTAAQQLCWRNPNISCLSLQFVVSAHKIDLQAVSPVTELLPPGVAEISKWNSPMVSELFCEVWHCSKWLSYAWQP